MRIRQEETITMTFLRIQGELINTYLSLGLDLFLLLGGGFLSLGLLSGGLLGSLLLLGSALGGLLLGLGLGGGLRWCGMWNWLEESHDMKRVSIFVHMFEYICFDNAFGAKTCQILFM